MGEGKESGPAFPGFAAPPGMRLEAVLWTGNRSQWFEANQYRLGRSVALKFLLPPLAGRRDVRESFLQAGRQAAVIVHPAALPIFNVFGRENCLAMQYCPGCSLREHAATLDPAGVAAIGETVMDCLSASHATGRCHGNLSPGNIFLDPEGRVGINDFFQPPVLAAGEPLLLGAAGFVPPEVAAGAAPDWRSDLYSLGRLLSNVLMPDHRSDELAMLLDGMQSDTPAHRGRSPEAVRAAFERIRRLEVARLGMPVDLRRGQRQYRRVPAEFEVSMRRRSATPEETAGILMKIRDIGESGVFVETDDDMIDVGSILELDFAPKGIDGNVHAFGIVRWRSRPPMVRGVGVQFVEVDQAGLTRVRQYLLRRQESNE